MQVDADLALVAVDGAPGVGAGGKPDDAAGSRSRWRAPPSQTARRRLHATNRANALRARSGGRAEDVGGQPLLSLVLLERLLPVRRSEGEDAGLGPGWQQAEEVPHVPDRLDPVHLASRQSRGTAAARRGSSDAYVQTNPDKPRRG